MKIAHIVNPVKIQGESDLVVAQPISFESMKRAMAYCEGRVDVQLVATCYLEDVDIVPAYFGQISLLNRSVLDFGNFQKQRKLPLLRDILQNLFDATDADYLIYTNVDIALMPNFYESVACLIESGHDALIINRRTISSKFKHTEELPLMYAEAGDKHLGYDCFIFARPLFERLALNNVCVGVSFVGLVFMLNLYRLASRFKLLEDAHLTFHVGNDRTWLNPAMHDYTEHNKREALKTIHCLEDQFGAFDNSLPSWAFDAVMNLKGSKRQTQAPASKSSLLGKAAHRISQGMKVLTGRSNPDGR